MARNSRKSTKSRSGGSTLFGVLAGLILGLAAAVAVALFVTKVPMPFVDKATRDPAKTLLPDVRDAPDPNIGLYGQNSPGGMPSIGPTATAPAPLPGAATGKPPPSMSDDISALIARLDDQPTSPAKPATAPATVAPAAKKDSSVKPANTQTTYYLQAGAFRSENDAEAIKAQILLMGLPAQVQKAQVNGSTINRVRVGPFKGIDEMNRSRVRLGEAKIVSSVVRP